MPIPGYPLSVSCIPSKAAACRDTNSQILAGPTGVKSEEGSTRANVYRVQSLGLLRLVKSHGSVSPGIRYSTSSDSPILVRLRFVSLLFIRFLAILFVANGMACAGWSINRCWGYRKRLTLTFAKNPTWLSGIKLPNRHRHNLEWGNSLQARSSIPSWCFQFWGFQATPVRRW